MRRAFLFFIHAVLAMSFVSCRHSDISERISAAEMAFASQDVAQTRRICDDIIGKTPHDGSIAATELARLSLLYMQLYDRTDDADALEQATRCYREAYAANADSAAHYYSNLPVELDNYAISLASLVNSIDNPADISDHHSSEDEVNDQDLKTDE